MLILRNACMPEADRSVQSAPVVCTWGRSSVEGQTSITTGMVAPLLNRVPFHPSKQRPYKFSALPVFSVDKKKF